MKNIVLIGMPGCGKSTCGVLVAKALCLGFVDTDLVIQRNEGAPLQEILDRKGNAYFAAAEESAVCGEAFSDAVIATGGSVVYSDKAMRHLKENGIVVYLKISFDTMIRRIVNIESRGIVLKQGETMEDMFRQRVALYETYADRVIECDGADIEKTVSKVIAAANE